MSDKIPASPVHAWRFFRIGGFDQVRIETADDLRHLDALDQKLWSVLACPTSGLEFDTRTLQLLDADGDGQIRQPEILAAVRWVCRVLKTPEVLFAGSDALPLAAIDETDEEGAHLLAAAKRMLAYLGTPEADAIGVADASDRARLFTPDHFNGDGIVPVALGADEAQRAAIALIVAHLGGETDLSGEPGLTRAHLDAFVEQARAVSDWWREAETGAGEIRPLGDDTAAAADVFDAVRVKIDDYFTRCRLAAFDERAAGALNPAESRYAEMAPLALNAGADDIASLPLALAGPDKPLPLAAGVNPVWAARIERLRDEVVTPILGQRDALSFADWEALSAKFAAYRSWLAGKPDTPLAGIEVSTLRALLEGSTCEALAELIERDAHAETAAGQVEAVERLARYNRDLVTLLRNFVSLADFYGGADKAIFQAGTLYLDQRSCELCMRVANMDKHGALAPLSGAYLVYCTCTRQGEAPITVVAALTGGDADEMLVAGRNGIFYDRQGRDWNATIAKVVENPISVRQAFWSPYKRVARMIGAQLQKFAASRDKAVEDKAAAGVADSAAKAEAGAAPATPQAFDIAKFAGIFAAIGLAVGAIGTALAAIVAALLSLPLWQIPLVVAGVMLLISGPSMLLAWLKLRQRNLGPLLDANGWAVNTRARINIPFGASLTGVAALPAGAKRSLEDPFAEKRRPWKAWLAVILLLVILAVLWSQGLLPLPGGTTPPG